MKIARLAARLVIGGLFVGHGTQKLAGWFGGPGLEGTEGMMKSLEMHPPRAQALAAGITETAGGALLAAGLATPLASASLVGTMITAIRKVHWSNGPWNTGGGYEYNLVLIAALLALTEGGPGELSLDSALGVDLDGFRWSLAALGLGAAASSAAVVVARTARLAAIDDERIVHADTGV
ncbi:MAG TPA: DoxX family protein [Marmoricola sp.]|nr:DoxX family protein [Marmoricola sp.]